MPAPAKAPAKARRRKSPNWTISNYGRAIAAAIAKKKGCSESQAVDGALNDFLRSSKLISEEEVIRILTKLFPPDLSGPDPLAP